VRYLHGVDEAGVWGIASDQWRTGKTKEEMDIRHAERLLVSRFAVFCCTGAPRRKFSQRDQKAKGTSRLFGGYGLGFWGLGLGTNLNMGRGGAPRTGAIHDMDGPWAR
jgi:hypothetical protein